MTKFVSFHGPDAAVKTLQHLWPQLSAADAEKWNAEADAYLETQVFADRLDERAYVKVKWLCARLGKAAA